MSVVLDQEGLASQAVNILIKYFKTYKDGVGSQSLSSSSSSSDTYPPDVLELLSTVVINAIKSHVSAFSDRTTLLEVRKVLLCVLLLKSVVSFLYALTAVQAVLRIYSYVYKYIFFYFILLVSQCQVSSKQLSPSCGIITSYM